MDIATYAESWHKVSYIFAMTQRVLLQDWPFLINITVWHIMIVHQAALPFNKFCSAIVHHV